MNSANNQKSNHDQYLSFEDVSKLFSLPLSEAADILGVSTSVLKKICNDNGLERWPHRKYLAGKSIEDIKKEAIKEKSKAPGGISQADRQKGNVTIGSATLSSPGVKDKTPRSTSEISKSLSNAHQPGSRSILTWRSHVLASSLTSEISSCLDEFKFGFPSSGLSRSTNKWWGSDSDNHDSLSKDDLKSDSEVNLASESNLDDSSTILCEEKSNSFVKEPISDMQEKVSLSNIRKRALDEGQKALKLVVSKKYEVDKLGKEEKTLLRRLFQTGFPSNESDGVALYNGL